MTKNRHHYVPKLYLRNFASAPRRINILNLRTGNFHHNGSLRDQCFRLKFYGKSDDVENHLMHIETTVAPTLSNIREHSVLPKLSSDDHKHLLIFVALQILRTTIAAESVSQGFNKAVDLIAPRDKDMSESKEKYLLEANNAIFMLLENYPLIAQCLDDLEMLLIINRMKTKFVTSDNPVVQYNQYCEGLKMGTTGALRRGLQLFLPLSPNQLILFYDKVIYKVGSKNTSSLELTDFTDLFTLNLLQAANADKVVLFSNWNDLEDLKQIARKCVRYRRGSLSAVQEFFAEDDPQHDSLLQVYPVPLNVKLNLSFMRFRRRVQGVPKNKRAVEYRKPIAPDRTSLKDKTFVKKFVRGNMLRNDK